MLRILRALGQLQKRDAAMLRETMPLLSQAAENKSLSVCLLVARLASVYLTASFWIATS